MLKRGPREMIFNYFEDKLGLQNLHVSSLALYIFFRAKEVRTQEASWKSRSDSGAKAHVPREVERSCRNHICAIISPLLFLLYQLSIALMLNT